MFSRKQRRGFSLIELLIVIAIILIIITIAVPKYNRTQMYMRETAAMKASWRPRPRKMFDVVRNTSAVTYSTVPCRFGSVLASAQGASLAK